MRGGRREGARRFRRSSAAFRYGVQPEALVAGTGYTVLQLRDRASRIVRRHGGRIWVKAAPNESAAFSFTLRPGGR